MHTAIIVPARLASVRFPRKLLFEVNGKPLILWTAERIARLVPDLPLYFAVAEEKLQRVLEDEGYQTILTAADLPSGTDRLAAANDQVQARYVINVQADEPLVTGQQIRALAALIQSGADIATLGRRFEREEDFRDPNKVKVVLDTKGHAMYFSRSSIPFARDHKGCVDAAWLAKNPCYLHLGMYAYSADFLKAFRDLEPGFLEGVEKLEQLRALENGYTIKVGMTDEPTIGIDAPEDISAFEAILAENG